MGANSSSRLDPVQDEEVITVVKGIRLTDRVIDRMKESPKEANQRPQSNNQAHPPVNLGEPWSPGERLVPTLPHCPSYVSSLVPSPLQVHVPLASVTQETSAPPPCVDSPSVEKSLSSSLSQENVAQSLHTESTAGTTAASADAAVISPSTSTEQSVQFTYSSTDEATVPPATTETTAELIEPLPTNTVAETVALPETPLSPDAPSTAVAPKIEEPVPPPSPVTARLMEELVSPQSSSALAIPSELLFMGQRGQAPTEETPAPPTSALTADPDVSSMLPLLSEKRPHLYSSSNPETAVNEEELRKQIRDELQKHLEEEMKKIKLKIQQQLQEEKAKADAETQAKAQLQIQAEVHKVLEREQQALQQSLKDAVMQERMNTEDERLVAQYYIQKLEEKEKDLAKQDILYRQQIAKLEEKTAKFTRVTAESFRKGLEDTHSRFKRSQIKPVCLELQNEILKCYMMNTGKTLTCSNIASLYIQCVDNAKQNKKVTTVG